MAYCTADQVKAALRLPTPDVEQADQIDRAVAAVSGAIDRHCRRSFAETASQSRLYVATNASLVLVDDVSSAAPVVETRASTSDSWATLDDGNYQLEPLNNLSSGGYWPFTRLRAIGGYRFPCTDDGAALVRVTATFGWSDVPQEVTEAAILQCVHLFKRPDAPFGISAGEFGTIPLPTSLDPDVAQMLAPYVLSNGPA